MDLILGSQSPRRKEILSFFNLPFGVVSSSFDEDSVPFEGDPVAYVSRLSKEKAAALSPRFPKSIILTADTTVYGNGKIYNKPMSKDEGFQSLTELVGKWHTVYTGITVRRGEEEYTDVEETKVLLHALTGEQIHFYQHQLHCEDKAGGYAIQRSGSVIVNRIDGCYYNVMGLPVNALRKLFSKVGIDLWKSL